MKPLTDAQKRVAIAKDVIGQITERKIQACGGHFVKGGVFAYIRRQLFDRENSPEDNESARHISIQPYLAKGLEEKQTCQVCAKGAIFIAHIQRFNKVTYDQCTSTDERTVYEHLPYFTHAMLGEIETLFEGVDYPWNSTLGRHDIDTLLKYYREQLIDLSDDDRIIHIMELLVENKGKKVLL